MSASREEKHIALLHAVAWLTKEQLCRKGFEDVVNKLTMR